MPLIGKSPLPGYALVLMRVPTRPVDGNAAGEVSSAGGDDEAGLAPSPVALPVLAPVGRMRVGAMGSVGT